MKSFLRCAAAIVLTVAGFRLALAQMGLSPAAENAIAASALEQALYRLMPLPAGPILARRAPVESRAELDTLLKQSATSAELFAVRAQEEERQLDFKAAERDWRQAAQLSQNKYGAQMNLADFYSRRLQRQEEIQALLQASNLPGKSDEQFKAVTEQSAWLSINRALGVAANGNLPAETRVGIYEAWIKRYPKQTEPLREYFQSLLAAKNLAEARNVAARMQAAFPNDLALNLESAAELARAENGDSAAMAVYAKQFSPLWPSDLRSSYFSLLSQTHQLREFLAEARSQSSADATAVEPVWRAFFYYEQQGKNDVAAQQLLELEARRSAAKAAWSAADLQTLGALYLRVSDYDEAAHAYYSLYALSGASNADKALALSSLIDLLLDVPEQPLQFGSRDLSIYRNVATLDRHPGFLNGILSLVLNTTQPEDQYQTASQTSVAYFHRAMAQRLIERMKAEFPASSLTAPLESKLFSAYSLYGQKDAILRLTPAWLAARKNSPDYTKVALLLAETYAATGKVPQELALYDGLLQKLGEASAHRPLGDVSENAQPENDAEKKAAPARSPEYAQVLDLYISRLVHLKRLKDAVGIYRREIDRNPDDPGIYERLALFVEQNHFDSDLELTYRAAMKRFDGTAWPDKLARFYIRHRQSDAYVALAKELTDKFDGTDLAKFISAAVPGAGFSNLVYRQVNLYAHQRFPHNLTFVRNLLASYQVKGIVDMGAYESLLRANWFYDAGLRNEFFQYLSRTGKLQTELAALPKPEQAAQEKNTAALLQYAEGKAWLANFEEAAPAFASLAAFAPGDQETTLRTISIERSLAPSVSGAFDKAVHLAEQRSRALPADSEAATLVGEIYADRELYAKATPWWNKIPNMAPGSSDGYLTAATIFWDYYQFSDSLRIIRNARTTLKDPALFAYEAGAIHENQGDAHAAIDEYLAAALVTQPPPKPQLATSQTQTSEGGEEGENVHPDAPMDENIAQNRLLVLAKRKQTAAEIDQRTAALAQAKPFNPAAFSLRLALLEDQQRRSDMHALLNESLTNIADLEQLPLVQAAAGRLGFDDLSLLALQRAVSLNTDPVEKLASRLELAKFYQSHQDLPHAESEYAALLSEHSNILGIVRANVDYYWSQKQSAKAVSILEAAAGRAQPSFQIAFRREAAQKAADSADYATARRLLDLLLESDPFNGDLLAAKAATYASQGDNAALMNFYSAQLSQLKSAQLSEDEKMQRSSALRRGYIGALITGKNYMDALEQYQLLLNAYPEDENLTREIARFAEANNLSDRVTKYYEKATADSPRNYRWPMVLARIDTSLRRYPEAIAALEKAVHVRPDRLDLYLAKADLETRLLRFDDALKTYQKIYDASYHDSQYLVSQAGLHARLGHNADVVRLLKAAYVEPHPKELNGYVSVMDQLANWRMYSEMDQTYQDAKPLIQPGSGSVEQLATLEAQALVALRKPVEALQTVVTIRRSSSDPKHPWSLRQIVDSIGASIDDLYTPEEKAAFAAKLETPQAIPPAIDIYHLACASGFTELAAQRLKNMARSKPAEYWSRLNTLQAKRLLDAELGGELDAIAPLLPNSRAPIDAAALAAYTRAGNSAGELRLSRELLQKGSTVPVIPHYAQLLVWEHADLPAVVRDLSVVNPTAANQLTQELIAVLPADQAAAVVQARGANLSKLWSNAYSALTGLFFLSPGATPHFAATLGPRTVAAQLTQKPDDALHGEGWYYYAARYGDYLTYRKDVSAEDMLPATVEAAPIASNSYIALGDDELELGKLDAAKNRYAQALELSPERADVYVRLAEAENALKHPQAASARLKSAMELLTKRASLDDYETVKVSLIRMNQYRLLNELRPAAEAMLSANIRKNHGYSIQTPAEGLLTDSPDRKAALAWLLQLAPDPRELVSGRLLTVAEKRPFYVAALQKDRAEVASSAGEGAVQARQILLEHLISYIHYLDEEAGDPKEAWTILHQIEPKTDRPAELLLELAAKTGHLSETLAQYDAGALSAPAPDQMLSIAASFRKDHPDWSLPIREWEYSRELRGENAAAASYFGMAQVRIEQKRPEQAFPLLRDVTLSIDAPFQNLPAAVDLLEKAGMNKEAAEYAREWRTAEPWNPEAVWAVARTTRDKALVDSVRKSDRATYALRAEAAQALRNLKAPINGSAELDLLTHASISSQEASQPFFVLARLRAKEYAAAIALKPSLLAPRLALAETSFAQKHNAFGMAAWNSYQSPGEAMAWLHSSSLDRAIDPWPDDLLSVEESAAAVLANGGEYAAAVSIYDRILQSASDKPLRTRIQKLKDQVNAKANLDQLNRGRAPVISKELTQAGMVRPRLMEGVSQ